MPASYKEIGSLLVARVRHDVACVCDYLGESTAVAGEHLNGIATSWADVKEKLKFDRSDKIIVVLAVFIIAGVTVFRLTSWWHSLRSRKPLSGHRRIVSGARTPPRSLSPIREKSRTSTEVTYENVHPPSRHEVLNQIQPSPSKDSSKQNLQTPSRDNPWQLEPHTLSATGISHEEVQKLGRFPDYAALSGVPAPRAFTDFDINKAVPRPYRPLRWAYHQTMSLTKLEPDWWIELEKSYVERIRQRRELYQKHGKLVLQTLPGSEDACRELMEMVLQFLCARYPHYFSIEQTSESLVLVNKILNQVTDLNTVDPLMVLLHNVPEDFALVLRNPVDGIYYFRAGLICSSLGWNVDTKIGLKLADVHGPVPDYKEKMQFSMDRYFAKMPTDAPIQRGSWGLEVGEPLFMPPGDPHEAARESQDAALPLSQINLRVDWQTLRRLPLSGAICFNFKALFTPIEKFREEPYVPGLLLKVLQEAKPSIMKYKATWHVEHVAKPGLAQMHAEQEDNGMVEKGWEPHTLAESPFSPGWKARWQKDMGLEGCLLD